MKMKNANKTQTLFSNIFFSLLFLLTFLLGYRVRVYECVELEVIYIYSTYSYRKIQLKRILNE